MWLSKNLYAQHKIILSTWYACMGWDLASLAYIEEPSGIFNELTRFLGTKSTVGIDAWKLSTAYHVCIITLQKKKLYSRCL